MTKEERCQRYPLGVEDPNCSFGNMNWLGTDDQARDVMARHPWAPGLIGTRATIPTSVIFYFEDVLGMLIDGGFSYALAHKALHALGSMSLGFVQELFSPDGSFDADATVLSIGPAGEQKREDEQVHRHVIDRVGVRRDVEQVVGPRPGGKRRVRRVADQVEVIENSELGREVRFQIRGYLLEPKMNDSSVNNAADFLADGRCAPRQAPQDW